MDKEKEQEKIKKCIDENFKTNTGKRIAYNRFILDVYKRQPIQVSEGEKYES